jgi:arylsulfatase A-like enzyme
MNRLADRLRDTEPAMSALRGMALAVWTGLIAGAGDLGYLALRRHFRHLLLFQGSDPHVVWIAPLSNALLFALIISVLALLGRRWAGLFRPGVVVGVLGFLLATSLLLLVPPLHPAAVVLLGLGLGVQAGRRLPKYEARIFRLVGTTLPVGLVLVALLAAAIPLSRKWTAWRQESRLPSASAGAPNVLLIILDTVRAFNLSAYGYSRPTSPGLARWSARGLRFEHAYSTAPWTLPSHASIMTGREAHELSASWQVALDETYPTLAEVLGARGYRTGGFVGNAAYCSRETGLARGFVTYDDYRVNFDRFVSSAAITRRMVDPRAVRWLFWGGDMLGRKPAPSISERFLHWAREDRSRPFFAFLNYYDAHVPYLPPEPYRSRFQSPGTRLESNLIRGANDTTPWSAEDLRGLEDAYDGALSYLDAQIDSLLTTLDRQGLLENTLVILTSDHGEEFGEHGVILHGNSLFRPAVDVPLFIWFAGRIPGGVAVPGPVSNRQIPATVVELLGIAGQTFPGPPLPIGGQDTSPAPLIYTSVRRAWQLPVWYPVVKGDMIAVADSGLRLIRGGDGREELYDFVHDPFERHDLLAGEGRQHDATRLRRLLDAAVNRKP